MTLAVRRRKNERQRRPRETTTVFDDFWNGGPLFDYLSAAPRVERVVRRAELAARVGEVVKRARVVRLLGRDARPEFARFRVHLRFRREDREAPGVGGWFGVERGAGSLESCHNIEFKLARRGRAIGHGS